MQNSSLQRLFCHTNTVIFDHLITDKSRSGICMIALSTLKYSNFIGTVCQLACIAILLVSLIVSLGQTHRHLNKGLTYLLIRQNGVENRDKAYCLGFEDLLFSHALCLSLTSNEN